MNKTHVLTVLVLSRIPNANPGYKTIVVLRASDSIRPITWDGLHDQEVRFSSPSNSNPARSQGEVKGRGIGVCAEGIVYRGKTIIGCECDRDSEVTTATPISA